MDKLLYLLSISILCMLSTILSFIASHSPLLPPIFCISTALEILSNCAYPKSSVILPSPSSHCPLPFLTQDILLPIRCTIVNRRAPHTFLFGPRFIKPSCSLRRVPSLFTTPPPPTSSTSSSLCCWHSTFDRASFSFGTHVHILYLYVCV